MKTFARSLSLSILIFITALASFAGLRAQVTGTMAGDLIKSAPTVVSPIRLPAVDTADLPFTETWDQGSFTFHNWIHSGNWSVNTGGGNPAPSAEYSGLPAKDNYNDTLQSITIDAAEFTCASIFLDYDFKLSDQNHTGAEFLSVEIRRDSVWKTIDGYRNAGDIPWTSRHLEIHHVSGKSFYIRFRTHGAHSQDFLQWYVDNIRVYAMCRPPRLLSFTQSQFNVNLSWQTPDCTYDGPVSQWIHWDDGVNFNSIGTCDCETDIAAHWTSEQIADLEGSSVTKISFFPSSAGNATYRARIWQGVNGNNLIADQDIPSFTYDQWNVVDLVTPALIDVSQDLYVGLYIHFLSGWPAGTDDGPAINGFGNMMLWSSEWETLLSLCPSCDYNWNIQAYVEALKSAGKPVILPQPPMPTQSGPVSVKVNTRGTGTRFTPKGRQNNQEGKSILMGYNIWRTDNTTDTATMHKLNTVIFTDTSYSDPIPHDSLGIYKYYVTAVMNDSATNTFLCESPSSNTVIVSVPAVGTGETDNFRIMVFPNPASERVVVQSDYTISSVEVMNYTCQTVLRSPTVNSGTAQFNVSNLQAGIYFVKVTASQGTWIVKIVILH